MGIPEGIDEPIFMFWTSTSASSLDKAPFLVKRELSSGPKAVLLSSRLRRDGGISGSDPDGNDPVPLTTKPKRRLSAIIPSAGMPVGTFGWVNVL